MLLSQIQMLDVEPQGFSLTLLAFILVWSHLFLMLLSFLFELGMFILCHGTWQVCNSLHPHLSTSPSPTHSFTAKSFLEEIGLLNSVRTRGSEILKIVPNVFCVVVYV